jgi:hypothetical protein
MLVEQRDIHAVVPQLRSRRRRRNQGQSARGRSRYRRALPVGPPGQQRANWCRISLAPIVVPVPGRWELPDIGGLRGQGLPGIESGVTLAVMSVLPGVLCDGRRGALDGCVPAPEVSNEGSELGGTFERGEGA